MRTLKSIETELLSVGAYIKYFGRPEVRELPKILVSGEKIKHCLTGRYEGGYALLCVTDLRVLLIDKKPFFLALEDIRYDMIMEVDFSYQLIGGQLKVIMPNKTLTFFSFKKDGLRRMTSYIQNRILQYRQQNSAEELLDSFQSSPRRVFSTNSSMPQTAPQASYGLVNKLPDNQGVHFSVPKAIHPYIQSTLTIRKQLSR